MKTILLCYNYFSYVSDERNGCNILNEKMMMLPFNLIYPIYVLCINKFLRVYILYLISLLKVIVSFVTNKLKGMKWIFFYHYILYLIIVTININLKQKKNILNKVCKNSLCEHYM